jgi:hypothetical protein
LRQLDALLALGAFHHGWPNRLWTAARVDLAAEDTDQLWAYMVEQLMELKFKPHLLASFIRQTKLPLR